MTPEATRRRCRCARRSLLSALAVASVLAACASSPREPAGRPIRPTDRSYARLIGATELATLRPGMTAYEVISLLRPQYLRGDGRSMGRALRGEGPVVYLDHQRLGGISALNTIRAEEIAFIRFVSGAQAIGEGVAGGEGIIQVVRKRMVRP